MDEQTPARARIELEGDAEVDWQVAGLLASQRFGEPYEIVVELHTQDLMAEPTRMLGRSASVYIERDGAGHELSGIIERIDDGDHDGHDLGVTVTIVPALVALGHRTNSRIFQEMSVPEILEQVLGEGLDPYGRSVDAGYLSGDYPPQEYTVQYKETDLAFVSRLMQEHGICYHFTSEDGVETMVLSDSDAIYEDLVSRGNADCVLPMLATDGSPELREGVREFRRASRLRPTVARAVVFDWLTPDPLERSESAEAASLATPNGAALEPEREDYRHDEPATLSGYRSAGLDPAAVDAELALRRGIHQRDAIRCSGTSTAILAAPGAQFELLDHPQPDLHGRYTVVYVQHALGTFAGSEKTSPYFNRFECLPAEVLWRPHRKHRRPRIPSVQTATVVGPGGEEIHTDEHGRIKVQFHWDREGELDENSSCFLRVVQPWAGNGWGSVFLPRIGMEVVVTFVDGDPDRPIVTGCLYNGSHSPPYPLPDERTKSTIKSQSSPGGEGFNELRFEDAAGAEEIYIHAQKNFNEVVLNDHNTTVGNNQTNNVDVDQTQTIHGNQVEEIDGDQDMSVGGNRTVTVTGDFSETVSGSETRDVTGDVSETFAAGETRNIAADQSETIGGSVTRTISGDVSENVSGALSQTITGGVSVTTPATYEVTSAAGITMTSPAGIKMVAPAGFQVVAPGGTTTVDSTFMKFGGGSGDAFSWQIGVCGFKVDIVGIAIGYTNVKMEFTGMKLEHCTAAATNTPAVIDSVGAAIQQGYVSLHTLGLLSVV